MLNNKNIIVGITGSIAAYKSYELIRTLQKRAVPLRCIVTAAGLQFVNVRTLESLLRQTLYTGLFDEYPEKRAIHIMLAEWADVVVVVPASADILAKAAAGIADDLLLCTVLATQAKIIWVPAMHANMWNHSATQTNVETLKSRGHSFVGPETGPLADGSHGVGHIAALSTIMKALEAVAPSTV